ncbi:MAG: MFS transporter, partial [Pseudomonadota bacterium]
MTIVRPPESPASSDEPRSIPVSANPPVSAVSRKYASIFTLQIAHDLPAALTATMAPTLFVKQLGMELSMIGVFFLPFVITALKWLWAPIVDNYYNPSLGRRKSWLAPLTFLVAASFLAVSFVEPSLDNLFLIVSLFMVKQIFFATQEVAADAYVVENLEDGERGVGASVVWLGKEFGQIIGFAGLVTVADKLGWQTAFSAAAGLFILFNLPVILRVEKPTSVAAQTQRADLRQFFARSVNWWIMSVVFAVSFAVQMPVAVIGPFLGDKGFT